MSTEVHHDDLAVDAFAAALKEKLAQARAKGRGGWQDKSDCPQQRLSDLLWDVVAKGDPRDVGNLAMFHFVRDEAILPRSGATTAAAQDHHPVSWRGPLALTCGQIAQLALFAGEDREPLEDQAVLIVEHLKSGHSGPGLYAHYEELPEEGYLFLDGSWPEERDEPSSIEAGAAAIQFALTGEEGLAFLRCWNEGDFEACRREWPEAPEACYVGADPLHVAAGNHEAHAG